MKSKVRGRRSEFGGLAIVALGSNLGDSHGTIHQAIVRLQELSCQPLLLSSLWQTSPVDCPPGSLPFVNTIVGLSPRPDETPESLLTTLRLIEQTFGRRSRKILNEPRPLDLDLITFGTELRNSAELTLPHPRAHERRFVLQPLNEIAPDLILPGQAKSVSELLMNLRSTETVRRL